MKDKRRIEEWYKEMNRQFEEDQKTHDFSDPEMDKFFAELLDKEMTKSKKCKMAKKVGIVAGIVALLLCVVLCGFLIHSKDEL